MHISLHRQLTRRRRRHLPFPCLHMVTDSLDISPVGSLDIDHASLPIPPPCLGSGADATYEDRQRRRLFPGWKKKEICVCPSIHQAAERECQIAVRVFHFFQTTGRLLDLVLEILARYEVGNLIVISLLLVILLHVLVALGQLAERGKRVRAELVQDTGNELRKLLLLAVAVDGERVGGNGSVDYSPTVSINLSSPHGQASGTNPWGRKSG